MATPKTVAQVVSLRDLSVHVDKAVELAAKKTGITPDPHSVVLRWDLIGRILRDALKAQEFANETVAALGSQAGKVHPAVLHVDKQIIAGFVPEDLMKGMRTLGRPA